MRQDRLAVAGRRVPLVALNTLVVGSGAAALNAAVIFWTHRHALARRPQPRRWVTDLLARRGA